ncbi:MAG: hypothetical protein H6700_10625 [Myxococcales bacterium]|nr:hypothetical protein [Myxococcales bacterium]
MDDLHGVEVLARDLGDRGSLAVSDLDEQQPARGQRQGSFCDDPSDDREAVAPPKSASSGSNRRTFGSSSGSDSAT